MVVTCEDVWREISNYLEEDLDPALKLAMEEHFAQCAHCSSVRDGMRNVIGLYGDKAMLPLPAGFYPRLHDRLAFGIAIPHCSPFVAPLLYAIPIQLLAYHTAVAKGTDVDQPRNLAKSVTVE